MQAVRMQPALVDDVDLNHGRILEAATGEAIDPLKPWSEVLLPELQHPLVEMHAGGCVCDAVLAHQIGHADT